MTPEVSKRLKPEVSTKMNITGEHIAQIVESNAKMAESMKSAMEIAYKMLNSFIFIIDCITNNFFRFLA